MKFMKLGSKPDTFQTADGGSIRYVISDLASDIIINVGPVKFCLHKFPLLSKSKHLQKLLQEADEENSDEISITDFPGGPKAFEICTKFCYGMTVTLNAFNVVAARCASEYLEMTEDIDHGNLIFKIEVFLNSSIFRSWKDTILALQATKNLQPWSENLNIVGRCIDSIASKTLVDPTKVTWSYTYNRKLTMVDEITENREKHESVRKDWWVEDISELEINLYKRILEAVKSKGRMDDEVIVEALKSYTVRWLPDNSLMSEDHLSRNKTLLENIISLLPSENAPGSICCFLLKLLKIAVLAEADNSSIEDLVNRISLKLDQASAKDLLVPSRSPRTMTYDIDLVFCIVNRFLEHRTHVLDSENVENSEKESDDLFLEHRPMLKVSNLIDDYLSEVACDPNLPLLKFLDVSSLISESERPVHDRLYRAINIYLKEHLSLTKAEKKKICALINVKKLGMDACMHAAQNDRLPLRMVVQVLFFEQKRTAGAAQALKESQSGKSTDEECEKIMSENQMSEMKFKLLPSRSRRIFDKLWGNKGHGVNQSSETSGSSQSPSTSIAVAETKSSASSSRYRRHSIS